MQPFAPHSSAIRVATFTRFALLLCFASLIVASKGGATEFRVDWSADLTGAAGNVTASGTIGTFEVNTFPTTIPLPSGSTLTTTAFGGLGDHEWTLVSDGVGIEIWAGESAYLSKISGTGTADGGTTPCGENTCGLTLSASPFPPSLTVSIDDGVSTVTSDGTVRLTLTLVREPGPASLIYTNVSQTVRWLGYREYCTLGMECWVVLPLTIFSDGSPLGPTPVISSVVADGPYTPSDFSIEMTGVATADGFSASGSVDCDATDSWDINVGTGRLSCLGWVSATFTVDKATEAVISYDSSIYNGVFTIDDGPTTLYYFEDPAKHSFEQTVILLPSQTYYLSYTEGMDMDPYPLEPSCPEPEPCVGSWDFSLEIVNPPEPVPVPGPGVVGLVGIACALGLGGWRLVRGPLRFRD